MVVKLHTHGLTNTCGACCAPHRVVLADCCLLALQGVARGAEEVAATVEVGAICTLVSTINGHFELWAADLWQKKELRLNADCREIKNTNKIK